MKLNEINYFRGDCWLFAQVLHDLTGFPIFGLYDNNGEVHHAFVLKDKDTAIDARGYIPVSNIGDGSQVNNAKIGPYELTDTQQNYSDDEYDEAEEEAYLILDPRDLI